LKSPSASACGSESATKGASRRSPGSRRQQDAHVAAAEVAGEQVEPAVAVHVGDDEPRRRGADRRLRGTEGAVAVAELHADEVLVHAAITRSSLPSPFKSTSAKSCGAGPVGIVPCGVKMPWPSPL
jgi:hypothetical protein